MGHVQYAILACGWWQDGAYQTYVSLTRLDEWPYVQQFPVCGEKSPRGFGRHW